MSHKISVKVDLQNKVTNSEQLYLQSIILTNVRLLRT